MFFANRNVTAIRSNVNKWDGGEENVLLITGLAGSGKTTLAEKLARENGSTVIHTDDIANEFEDRFLEGLSEEDLNSISDSDVMVAMVEDIVYRNKGKKIIIEGIHLLAIDKELLKDKPLIISGTGMVKSNIQATKRDHGLGPEHLVSLYGGNINLIKKRNELIALLSKNAIRQFKG